jgi:hypothetical protein
MATVLKDNPAKPWKAVVALAATFIVPAILQILTDLLDNGDLPFVWTVVITGVVTSIAVYLKGNPKVVDTSGGDPAVGNNVDLRMQQQPRREDGGLARTRLAIIIGTIAAFLVGSIISLTGSPMANAAPAPTGDVAKVMRFMTNPLPTEDSKSGGFWDASVRGDRSGHSFYIIRVGHGWCQKFWNADFGRTHDVCSASVMYNRGNTQRDTGWDIP